jgi:hypothetical protein
LYGRGSIVSLAVDKYANDGHIDTGHISIDDKRSISNQKIDALYRSIKVIESCHSRCSDEANTGYWREFREDFSPNSIFKGVYDRLFSPSEPSDTALVFEQVVGYLTDARRAMDEVFNDTYDSCYSGCMQQAKEAEALNSHSSSLDDLNNYSLGEDSPGAVPIGEASANETNTDNENESVQSNEVANHRDSGPPAEPKEETGANSPERCDEDECGEEHPIPDDDRNTGFDLPPTPAEIASGKYGHGYESPQLPDKDPIIPPPTPAEIALGKYSHGYESPQLPDKDPVRPPPTQQEIAIAKYNHGYESPQIEDKVVAPDPLGGGIPHHHHGEVEHGSFGFSVLGGEGANRGFSHAGISLLSEAHASQNQFRLHVK